MAQMKQIRQAISEESLFLELQRWCQHGAGRKRDRLLLLSAFASGSGVEALEPFFDIFLADGNSVEVIVGVDRGGTSRDAIRRLSALQKHYPQQFHAHVFHAPSREAIFHPKLYMHTSANMLSVVAGSGNLTLGGLSHNFESLYLYPRLPRSGTTARAFLNTWETFATPSAPLQAGFLRPLTTAYARDLIRRLPKKSVMDAGESRRGLRAVWHPISKIVLSRSGLTVQSARHLNKRRVGAYLLVDVLTETRKTQMQFPLLVVEEFFGLDRHDEGTVRISAFRGAAISQPIERTVVKSSGKAGRRLMRRIEMPQIAALDRPAGAVFVRLPGRRFAVKVLERNTPQYRRLNALLREHGQQPSSATRRYFIGRRNDLLWRDVQRLLAERG